MCNDQKKWPRISIVTPSFNQAKYLEDTILSVISQNYPNLEYIIIDGGSKDGSIDIIKKYEKQLAYWVSEPDNGMYCAIQKGFDRSTGEIMAWINSDDMYHRNALFTIAEVFGSFGKVSWLVGAITAFDEFNRTVFIEQSKFITKLDIYNHDLRTIQQESVFWRRSLWEKVGSKLNVDLKYAGDFDLWLRFFSYEQLYVTHSLIGGFRWRRSNQLSFDHSKEYLQEVETALDGIHINDDDRRILKGYNRILNIVAVLKRLKFIRTNWIIEKYRKKYFPKQGKLTFDRSGMKFVLKD